MAITNLGRIGFVVKGDYQEGTTYKYLDLVYYSGQSYVCKVATTTALPSDSDYWQIAVAIPDSFGDFSSSVSTSVDGEVVLFDGTDGKTAKRATQSGIAKLTSGVLSAAVAGTDYAAPASGSGLVKTASGTLSVASAGTDYPGLSSAQTFTAAQAFSGGATITSLKETATAIAASEIDLATGNLFTKTISVGTTFTLANVPATGNAASFILELTNGGAAAVTWWSGMKWPGGTAPTLTASGVDVLGFYTRDGGTTWRGFKLGLDSK